MPPSNLHGESTPDFIVRMYIECTFDFIEAPDDNHLAANILWYCFLANVPRAIFWRKITIPGMS